MEQKTKEFDLLQPIMAPDDELSYV